MRSPRVLPILALAIALLVAGCIKEEPIAEAATEDTDADPSGPTVVAPTPTTPPPSSPPPASTPPPATSPPPAATQPAPTPAPAPRVEVLAWNGSMTGLGAGAQAPPPGPSFCCAQVAPTAENADVEFTVGALKGIVVELVWTDPQFDLDLVVNAADYDVTPAPPEPYTGHRWYAGGGAPGQPEGRAVLVLTDAEALAITGTWTAHVGAKGPANAVAFAIYVSLFHDEAPAADYTAAAVPSGNP